jgi:GT2 family glycosyltransferase
VSSLSVAAVVVSHAAPEFLEKTLDALAAQTSKPEQVVVVDTAGDAQSQEIIRSRGLAMIQPGEIKLGAAIAAGVASLQHKPSWLWLLHDDSAPEPNALERLSIAAEISPSVAVIGPKLLRWEKPIEIQQMGLTLTATGRPFLLVEHEYDQGQHDNTGDTLAVSTAGMLVSLPLWEKLGGIDDSTPTFAHDLEFCMRARAAGFRVVLEASARVHHAGLAMNSKRSRGWLGGSRRTALAKAHLHLATQLMPIWLVPIAYLALPIAWLVLIPKHLLTKRPARIFGQLGGWIWAWATIGSRLAARKKTRGFGNLNGQRALFASGKQMRRRRSLAYEYEAQPSQDQVKGIFASGGAWVGLLPVLMGLLRLPSGAIESSHLLPLGRSFDSVWGQTAVNVVPYLSGINLPSEPVNWIFSLFAFFSPSNPSIGLNWFLFLAPTLAFYGAWSLLGQVTQRGWLRNTLGLLYALSPITLALQTEAAVLELVSVVLVPWIVFMLLRTAFAYSTARSWRWLALAALAGAVIAAAAPTSFVLLVVFALGLGAVRPRRLAILPWFALPGFAILAPWIASTLEISPVMAVSSSSRLPGYMPDSFSFVALAIVAALALLALSLRGGYLNFTLVILAAGAYVLAGTSGGALFAEGYQLALLLLLLVVPRLLEPSGPRPLGFALALATTSLALSSGYLGLIQTPVNYQQASNRLAPALVVALADVEPEVRTLRLVVADQIDVDFIWGDGRSQDERNLIYSALSPQTELSGRLAQLAASVVAGNPSGVQALLSTTSTDFVLIARESENYQQAVVAISTMTLFQASGESEYGALFRVLEPSQSAEEAEPDLSLRRLQLGVLAAFVLIAIPTPATIRGYRRKSVES